MTDRNATNLPPTILIMVLLMFETCLIQFIIVSVIHYRNGLIDRIGLYLSHSKSLRNRKDFGLASVDGQMSDL